MKNALRRRTGLSAALASAAAVMLAFAATPARAQGSEGQEQARYVPGELLVRFDPGISGRESRELAGDLGAQVVDRVELVSNLALVDLPPGLGVDRADALFEAVDGVRYAEPNALRRIAAEPDDPFYLSGSQWGLDNPETDADIDAPGAWGLATGDPDVTVAVIDTGASIGHPDLEANAWTNPGETLDGVDNDGNGLVDDLHGYDFVHGDTDPVDDNDHGTHVAGIAGAVGDNGIGVTGVNWEVGLMPIKAGDDTGHLALSHILSAIQYAVDNGARVVNASYTGDALSFAERNAIAAADDVLFVAAAGNQGTDNDAVPRYPCNYDLANVICVAATNQNDNLWASVSGGSNFGKSSVDLAAPGSTVLSTIPFPASTFEPPIFEDDFEAGLAAWTVDPGGTWATEENPPTEFHLSDSPGGSYAANADASVRLTDPLDLSDGGSCRMRFGLAHALGSGDRLWVEGSTDPAPAAVWTPLATYSGSGITAEAVVELFGFSRTAGVYLRFRLVSDDSGEADGAHVDDVEVECVELDDATIYEPKSGTSMATPHVTGTAALLLDLYPSYTTADLRAALLGNVDRLPSLHCKVATGGRLNAFNALDRGAPATEPALECPLIVEPPDPVAPKKPNKCKKIKDRKKRKKCYRKLKRKRAARV